VDGATPPAAEDDVVPQRRPAAAWLVAAGLAGAAVVLLANREPLFLHVRLSVNDVWSLDSRLDVLGLFLFPVLGAVLSLAFATPARTAAAAGLAVLGFAEFVSLLGSFGSGFGADDELPYGLGLYLGLLGAVLMIAAGLAAGFGAASGPVPAARRFLTWVVSGVAAFTALVPALYLIVEFRFWYFLPLELMLFVAVALGGAARRLTPLAGGAALATLGVSIGLGYAELFADLGRGPLSERPVQAVVAVGVAAIVFAAAGLALLVRGARAPWAVPAVPADPAAGNRSEATRHLCVAMHLDRDLARRAMREVIDGDVRAIAPSLGVDLGLVVRHCLVARHRQRVRDAVLVCVILLLLLDLFAFVVHRQVVPLRYLVATLALGWLAVAVEQLVARHGVVARRLTREEFARQPAPVLDDAEEARVRALEELERGNVTPYGGFFPFVGSGREVGGWSFALSVLRGGQDVGGERVEPQPFELAELYEAVRLDIDHLAIDGLAVEDRLYVDGERLAGDRRFLLPGPPPRLRTDVTPERLAEFVRAPERVNRVYRCIRVYGWDGEYVLSVYLNFTRAGPGLFAEARYFLLLPPKPEYVALGAGIVPFSAGAALRTSRRALRATPRTLVTAVRGAATDVRVLSGPPSVGADAWSGAANLGATTSLRELAQGVSYRRYFQRLDLEMTRKIVERRLLGSIAGFLREHRIDTSELEERQAAILNYGLIVSGGSVRTESMAVGQGAQSLISRVTAAVRPPGEEGVKK
jgi:hypothetical protein